MSAPKTSRPSELNPDTPEMASLRKQVNDLHARMARQIEHVRLVEAQKATEAAKHSEAMRLIEKTVADLRARAKSAEAEVRRLSTETREIMEARLAAGAERRKDAIICLNALLTCEDDNLSDEAYDERMDRVVKYARRIVGAEREAILRAQEKTKCAS